MFIPEPRVITNVDNHKSCFVFCVLVNKHLTPKQTQANTTVPKKDPLPKNPDQPQSNTVNFLKIKALFIAGA